MSISRGYTKGAFDDCYLSVIKTFSKEGILVIIIYIFFHLQFREKNGKKFPLESIHRDKLMACPGTIDLI